MTTAEATSKLSTLPYNREHLNLIREQKAEVRRPYEEPIKKWHAEKPEQKRKAARRPAPVAAGATTIPMKDVSLKTFRYEEMKNAGVNITDKGTSFVELFEKRFVLSATVQVSVNIDVETNTIAKHRMAVRSVQTRTPGEKRRI